MKSLEKLHEKSSEKIEEKEEEEDKVESEGGWGDDNISLSEETP